MLAAGEGRAGRPGDTANYSVNRFDSRQQLLPVIIFQINGALDRNNICININPERTNGHKL